MPGNGREGTKPRHGSQRGAQSVMWLGYRLHEGVKKGNPFRSHIQEKENKMGSRA